MSSTKAPAQHFAIVEETPAGPRARYTVPLALANADDLRDGYVTRVAASGNTVTVNVVTI